MKCLVDIKFKMSEYLQKKFIKIKYLTVQKGFAIHLKMHSVFIDVLHTFYSFRNQGWVCFYYRCRNSAAIIFTCNARL